MSRHSGTAALMAIGLVFAIVAGCGATQPAATIGATMPPMPPMPTYRITAPPPPLTGAEYRAWLRETWCGRPTRPDEARDPEEDAAMRRILTGAALAQWEAMRTGPQARWDAMTPEQREADRDRCADALLRWMSADRCTMPAPGDPVPECMRPD